MAKLICPVYDGALHYPDQPALQSTNRTLTYGQLHHVLLFLQGELRTAGFKDGDHLFLVQKNTPELILLLWACWREGIIACPINPAFPHQKQRALREQIDARSINLADFFPVPDVIKLAQHSIQSPSYLDDSLLSDLIFTSGSSGTPKAVAHYLRNHLANAQGSIVPISQGDGWLLSLPLYHVGGLAIVFRCFLAGATIILPTAGLTLAEQLHQDPITHLSLVPTQLYRLLHSPDFHFRHTQVQHLLLGGAPLPSSLIDDCAEQGLIPWVSYGLSEMASQVCTARASQPGLVGQVLPGRQIIIQQDEICVKGDTLFAGYYQTNGRIHLPLDADGWFHTGDAGYWQDNQLIITGRIDNQFVSGGENIQPEQIEQQLLQHEAVAQALVVPVPDDEWGMRCVCFLDWHHDPIPVQELAQWLRQSLPGYMIPKNWLDWPELPAGQLKIQRGNLKQLAQQAKKIPA
jgi:O-succinylbenzoic acid--CoA ligase